MKILAVSPTPLYPIATGLELRAYNLIKPLCDDHQFSVLCFNPRNHSLAEIEDHHSKLPVNISIVEYEPLKKKSQSFLSKLKDFISPSEPPMIDYGRSSIMRTSIDKIINEDKFDLIFIISPFMINYFLDKSQIPIVVDLIDDTSLLFYRDIKRSTGLINKTKAVKDWLAIMRAEQIYYSRFKEIVLTSEVDAKITASLCPNSNITVISNGVDTDYFGAKFPSSEDSIIIFTGVMNYSPNILAMQYFCDKILPLIENEIPDIKLYIVGRNPIPEIQQLGERFSNVEVTGEVEDIRPYLGMAKVYVCPLLSGAGIKNKILEAWAAGRPVVATSMSCNGIDVSEGNDIIVADHPEDFANAVIDLFKDENKAAKLTKNAKEKLSKKYNWGNNARELEKVFLKSVKDKHEGSSYV